MFVDFRVGIFQNIIIGMGLVLIIVLGLCLKNSLALRIFVISLVKLGNFYIGMEHVMIHALGYLFQRLRVLMNRDIFVGSLVNQMSFFIGMDLVYLNVHILWNRRLMLQELNFVSTLVA